MGKYLILNPNPENLDEILQKSNIQNKKNGPFDAIFLLGDVLPKGINLPKVPIDGRTYFTKGTAEICVDITSYLEARPGMPSHDDMTDLDKLTVVENLTYLKSSVTILTLKSKQTVMAVNADGETEKQDEVRKAMETNSQPIDILITYDWPQAIARLQELMLIGNRFIDDIVKHVKPRYHFAVGLKEGKFFENKPFKWDNGAITRFISLGLEGSGSKWFYAFTMNSDAHEVEVNLGINPFTNSESYKRSIEIVDDSNPVVKKQRVVTPDQCFFCLSNPSVETHMIISIGTYAYLTVAKGPLTRSNQNLPFSGHAIIIPIEHIPTLRLENSHILDSPIFQEMENFKQSLVKAYVGNNTIYKLVFFEIDLKTNIHHHTQVLPIPDHLFEKFESALYSQAELNNNKFSGKNHKLVFKKFENERDEELLKLMNSTDHMMFTLYDSETEKSIYIAELSDIGITMVDLQFPRRVLANLLNLRKRIYWENCKQPKYKESQDCEAFKNFYQNYDFTIKNK